MSQPALPTYRNPKPTVDLIVELPRGEIVLIQRRNPPFGLALPGGFVDEGESLEQAAIREAREEIGLQVQLIRQFHTYSEPGRDPRQHTISTVFLARAIGTPVAGDDARDVVLVSRDALPDRMAFDHREILEDFLQRRY